MSRKSIHDLEDSFSDKSSCLSINCPCLLPEMFVFTLVHVRKHGVICSVDFTYTRSLLDIKTWNVSSRKFLQFLYLMCPLLYLNNIFMTTCTRIWMIYSYCSYQFQGLRLQALDSLAPSASEWPWQWWPWKCLLLGTWWRRLLTIQRSPYHSLIKHVYTTYQIHVYIEIIRFIWWSPNHSLIKHGYTTYKHIHVYIYI